MSLTLSIDAESSPRIITVLAPDVAISMQQLVNLVRDWEDDQEDGLIYDHLLNAYGKQDLGSGTMVGVTVQLLNAKLAFEARPGPTFVQCNISGGNLVALDVDGNTMAAVQTTAYTQVIMTNSSSATLVEQDTIQYAAFGGGVTIDAVNGGTGTVFPMGTSASPVNNLTDAVAIVVLRGFDTLRFKGNFTFGPTAFLYNYCLHGDGMSDSVFTFQSGSMLPYCCIHHADVNGVIGGITEFIDCYVHDISSAIVAPSAVEMMIKDCLIGGSLQTPDNYTGSLNLLNSWSSTPTGDPVVIDMNGAACKVFAKNFAGYVKFRGITHADCLLVIDASSGEMIIDSSCTAGTIKVRGIGVLTDNHTGTCSVDTDGLMNQITVATATDALLTANHGYGLWVSGTAAAEVDNWAIANAVNQILTADHGYGLWVSGGGSAIVDNEAIASAVNSLLTAQHGLGIWVSGNTAIVDNWAIADAVNQTVTANHGEGIWTSGSTAIVDNDAIAEAVNQLLTANHGYGIWVSGTSATPVDNEAIAAAVNQLLNANHGLGIWTSGVGDTTAIAVAVDAQLSATHGAGSWVDNSGGSGAYNVNVTVNDTGAVPIPGVLVSCYNNDESLLVSYATTNLAGQVGFLLDNGAYKIRLAKYATYTFTNPQALTVSGATSATYTGTLIIPPPAPTVETCSISGRCLDGQGYPIVACKVQAVVIGSLVTFIDANGNSTSVGSDPVRTITDANGVWALTLIRSNYLHQGGSAGVGYKLMLKGRGMDETKDITVPNASTAKYEAL